jgi:hypothetical protein
LFRRPCHLLQGVRYTHRSNFLHALITTAPDALALSASSTILMVVPMFHANSWGLNFSGAQYLILFASRAETQKDFHVKKRLARQNQRLEAREMET